MSVISEVKVRGFLCSSCNCSVFLCEIVALLSVDLFCFLNGFCTPKNCDQFAELCHELGCSSAMEHVLAMLQALVFNHKHENQENPVCQEVLCFSSGTVV